MDLKNRTYKNNKTGEVIKVIDSFENIAILENKEKIDVRRLTDNNFFTEQIDPNNFFSNQSAYNILADKIKSIPQNHIKDDSMVPEEIKVSPLTEEFNGFAPTTDESVIVVSSEEDERMELAKKYGVNTNQTNSLQKQNDAFAKLLGDDTEELPIIQPQPQYSNIQTEEPIQRIEINRDEPEMEIKKPIMQVEDPIITMFKRTKRNLDLNISFDINDKIPRKDFIEMMEESYEISIIDFLAEEFTNKIIKDPSIIKNKIKEKINELVYGKPNKGVNSQITDSVTQTVEEKPKSTRKPKPNTAQGEKPGYKAPSRNSKKESIDK